MNDEPSMSEDEDVDGDKDASAKSSGVKTVRDYVDIVYKVGIGIILGALVVYLNQLKEEFDEGAKCAEIKNSIVEFVHGKRFSEEILSGLVHIWVPEKCSGTDRTAWVKVLYDTSSWGTPGPLESLTAPPEIKRQAAPPVIPGPPPAPETTASPKEGWVAVGYAGSNDFNFVDENGNKITEAPLKGSDPVNDIML